MTKAIVISLEGDIPDTEMDKAVTVTIETRTYAGTVEAIVTYTKLGVETSQVTLEGAGLVSVPST